MQESFGLNLKHLVGEYYFFFNALSETNFETEETFVLLTFIFSFTTQGLYRDVKTSSNTKQIEYYD